ncbi:hypothetical protein AYO38_08860 [bacterium SCGC AG-212-C10]|nr:hypothetical protein AYO38_08860 [bacterium SCGC AG-212-C10]
MKAKVLDNGKALLKEISDDDVSGMAAELSYRFFLALFPFAIFLAATGGFVAAAAGVDNPSKEALDLLGDSLPSDAASVISKQVEAVIEERNAGLLSFAIIGVIWASAGAMGGVMKALNRAYDTVETRPFWKRTLLSVGLTMLTAGSVIVALAILITGQIFAQDIADAVGLGSVFKWTVFFIRIPLALLIVMLATAFLYWATPNTNTPFKWVTPGAILFTITWLAGSLGFAFYVTSFGNYNATYGALGGVVVLLTWFYLTGFMVLVGAELNAMLDERIRRRLEEGEREEAPVDPVMIVDVPAGALEGGAEPRPRRPYMGLGAAVGAYIAAYFLRRTRNHDERPAVGHASRR